jgi:thiamine biosynthesis lipoprotein
MRRGKPVGMKTMLDLLRYASWMLPLFAAITLEGCLRGPTEPYRRETTAMDTFVSVTIFDDDLDQPRADEITRSAFQEIRRIEGIATDYADTSDIGRVNIAPAKDTVEVSPEISGLIRESLAYSRQSEGAFDITIGPIVHKWDFLTEHPAVPSNLELAALLPLVNYRLIYLDRNRVFLPKRGMRLDLGAIAKGYAVDAAIQILKQGGVKRAIVDLGGNLGVYWEGTRLLESARATIYVRNPRQTERFFGSFKVGSAGVSTSGDYQRYFTHDGIRYHHILDPKSGQPARGVVSVTIIAGDAMKADALSTMVFLLGKKQGMKTIEELPDVEGLIIYEEGESLAVDLSSGLLGKFTRGDSP